MWRVITLLCISTTDSTAKTSPHSAGSDRPIRNLIESRFENILIILLLLFML